MLKYLVEKALKFENMDEIPVWDNYWPKFLEIWRQRNGVGSEFLPQDYYDICMAIVGGDETLFPSKAGKVDDDGGDEIIRTGWGALKRKAKNCYFSETLETLINEPGDLAKIQPEPVNLELRFERFEERIEREKKKGRYVCAKMGGIYCRSQFVRSEDRLLMDMALDEGFCRDFFTLMAEHLESMALETLKRGDLWEYGLFVYDDMANSKAPMFSPDMFEKYLLPLYRQLIDNVKRKGCRHVFFHSDGNIAPLLDMLVDAGFEGFNPLEPRCGLDLVDLRTKYPRTVFFGGVCNTQILPRGNKGEIERHLRPLIELAKQGGVVLGQASIGNDIDPEIYDYYINLVRNS